MLLNRVSFTASYTPRQLAAVGRAAAPQLDYERYDWKVTLKLNNADFYDLFGPTKRSLKGYSAGIGWTQDADLRQPEEARSRHRRGVPTAGSSRCPGYQNIAAPYDELFDAAGQARTTSNNRSSLGARGRREGHALGARSRRQLRQRRLVPLARGSLRHRLRAAASSTRPIWFRDRRRLSRAATATIPSPTSSSAASATTGSTIGRVKRYREWYAFPGVELNADPRPTTSLRRMLEWNLPPLRFGAAARPGFYVTWTCAGARFRHRPRHQCSTTRRADRGRNVGAQIDLRITLLSAQLTLSLGSPGFRHGRETAPTSS